MDLEIQKKIIDSIECMICMDIPYDKCVECSICFTLFCNSCLEEMERVHEENETENDFKCPSCLQISKFYYNGWIQKMLNMVKVECKHCSKKVERGNMNDHLDLCVGKLIRCPLCEIDERKNLHKCNKTMCYRCHVIINRNEVATHDLNCEEVLVICADCGKVETRREMEFHKLFDCIHRSIGCDDCGECVKACQLDHHKRLVCELREIECVWCKEKIIACDYDSHYCEDFCKLCNQHYDKGTYKDHILSCPSLK